ncbi:helix-turn-helix domain-containing protein [Acidisarcina polymorpha]
MSKPNPAETRKSRKARTAAHQETYDIFLQRLIIAREELGLSQRDVCERMGMPHSFLSKCEIGDRRVDVMEFLQLAQIYGKPLQFFLD